VAELSQPCQVIHYNASLDNLIRAMRVIAVIGPPDSGKTSSLYTLAGKVAGISCPLEKGTSSIPFATKYGEPVDMSTFQIDDISDTKINWVELLKIVEKEAFAVLSGAKYGSLKEGTFVVDGGHKLYEVHLAAASGGANFRGAADMTHYNVANGTYRGFLNKINGYPNVQRIVWTFWEGIAPENPMADTRNPAVSRGYYFDLPKSMERKVPGEFAVKVFCEVNGPPYKADSYKWKVKPIGDVKIAGVKLPIQVMERMQLPQTIAQDFEELDKLFVGELTRVWNEVRNPQQGDAQ